MGGNAAIGYQQAFDLEGESGIVVRGIATAVRIAKIASLSAQNALPSPHRYEGAVPFFNYQIKTNQSKPTTSEDFKLLCVLT